VAAMYVGSIVQYAQPPQNPSWIVGRDLQRRYVHDSRTYFCLRGRGVPDVGALPSATLNLMPDLTNIWAQCPPGDIDQDGRVSIYDLSILLSYYPPKPSSLKADDNYDGVVDIFDLSILLSNYGRTS